MFVIYFYFKLSFFGGIKICQERPSKIKTERKTAFIQYCNLEKNSPETSEPEGDTISKHKHKTNEHHKSGNNKML